MGSGAGAVRDTSTFQGFATTNALVKHIKKRLSERGIAVQVHRSKSTNSIYLRFDYGVLNSCRVADHQGKGYAFKYEIGSHINQHRVDYQIWNGRSTERMFYHSNQADKLVDDVLYKRSNLRAKYGKDNYDKFLEDGKKKEWKW